MTGPHLCVCQLPAIVSVLASPSLFLDPFLSVFSVLRELVTERGVMFVVGGADLLGLCCANMGEESKFVVVTDVIPVLSRVIDQKLNGSNYLE